MKKQIPLSALIKLIGFYSLIIGIIGLILFFGITLTRHSSNPSVAPTITITPTISVKQQLRQPAKEGEFCGGIAAIQCLNGYTCKLSGNYPDAGGTCIRK